MRILTLNKLIYNINSMATQFTAPRGTKDILPDEVKLWQFIENKAMWLFDLYNFKEIRTPIFESTHLFERSIGDDTDIVEKEMYTFEDKGKRIMTLRPEGTASIVRSVLQHNLTAALPQKLYYMGPMFRYERPQAGRYRQFHQIGVEYIGSDSYNADVELIAMAYQLLVSLGITHLKVTINSIGDEISRPVINEAIRQFFGNSPWFEKQVCPACIKRFNTNPLRILDCKLEACKAYHSGLPDIKKLQSRECQDHFNSVCEGLDHLNIPFEINPFLVRGLDYYTKTTFEIIGTNLGAQNAICGGGRYNGLIQQFGGKHTPAVGFACGMERIVMMLQNKSTPPIKTTPIISIIPIGTAQVQPCVSLAEQLRFSGIKCEMIYDKDSLKAQLKHANKIGASISLIYGEEEAEKQQVCLKYMDTGKQELIPLSAIISTIHTHLELN
jgi:histidyl-tRNA synthetase